MLDFDFFEVLDSVTIARSRKHIQKYYNTADIGSFPERLKPISERPCLTDLNDAINYNQIYELLMQLNLHIYTRRIMCSRASSISTSIPRRTSINKDVSKAYAA